MDRSTVPYLLLHCFLLLALSPTCLAQPRNGTCQSKCGNLTVDYPFGIGKPECYLQGFQILCTNNSPVLAALNLSVSEIRSNGTIVLLKKGLMAFQVLGKTQKNPEVCLNLSLPFTISGARYNRFVAIGCDTDVYLNNSMLHNSSSCQTQSISGQGVGLGNCEIALPEGGAGYCYRVAAINNYAGCEQSTQFSSATLMWRQGMVAQMRPDGETASIPFVADWAVESCLCGPKASCHKAMRGSGSICECRKGYTGNPYLHETGSCSSAVPTTTSGKHGLLLLLLATLLFCY